MMPKLKLIHGQLKLLHEFLKPLLPLANSHLVQYISEDQWNTLLCPKLRNELSELSYNELNLIPTANLYLNKSDINEHAGSSDSLQTFVQSIRNHYLDSLDILTPKEEINLPLNVNEEILENCRPRMSSKKTHEVPIMTGIIGPLCEDLNIKWVVDLGSGLGYLSSCLSIYHNLNVLAVDSSSSSIDSALKRYVEDNKILLKKSQKIRSKQRMAVDDISISSETGNNRLFGMTKLIADNEDLSALVNLKQAEKENNSSSHEANPLALVGLHTCGNLTSTSLKLFASNSSVKFLCNVGCCYHLINEEFFSNNFYINKFSDSSCNKQLDHRYNCLELDPYHQHLTDNETIGFPLSSLLREENCILGRNARMLATNAPSRINYNNMTEDNKPIFWRALLQVLVNELNGFWPTNGQVGRKTGKRSVNFRDYCRKALKHLGLSLNISDENLDSYYEQNKHKMDDMYRFFMLKSSLGPLIEGIILLDRLAFLHEQGFENSHVVQLFDSSISPRCMAILSIK